MSFNPALRGLLAFLSFSDFGDLVGHRFNQRFEAIFLDDPGEFRAFQREVADSLDGDIDNSPRVIFIAQDVVEIYRLPVVENKLCSNNMLAAAVSLFFDRLEILIVVAPKFCGVAGYDKPAEFVDKRFPRLLIHFTPE